MLANTAQRWDIVWQKIIGLHFDFSYLWNSHNKLTIIHIHGIYTPSCVVCAAVLAIVCVWVRTLLYVLQSTLLPWPFERACLRICRSDGDMVMSVWNGLFFITFSLSFAISSFLTPLRTKFISVTLCNNGRSVLCLECSVSKSFATPRNIFTKFMVEHYYLARPPFCFL